MMRTLKLCLGSPLKSKSTPRIKFSNGYIMIEFFVGTSALTFEAFANKINGRW